MKKAPSIQIALAQINTTVGDISGNLSKIILAIHKARSFGSDLVLFPEMTLTGYPPEDLLYKNKFIEDNKKALGRVAASTQGVAVILGFADKDARGCLYNAAAICQNGRLIGVYHKMELPNYGVFDEKRYFKAGDRPFYLHWKGRAIGVTICEDIWPETAYVYSRLYKKNLSLLVNLSASPFHVNKQQLRVKLLSRLTAHLKCPAAYLNLVGGQDELVFEGGSFVMSKRSEIIGQCAFFEEDMKYVRVRLDGSKNVVATKKQMPAPMQQLYRALLLGLRDYVRKNGFKKVLIGLSGGIDSALVLRLSVDALGASNVISVTMPSKFTSRHTLKDAKILAGRLGVPCHEIAIHPLMKAYLGSTRGVFAGTKPDITEENLQARIRGNLLMAMSNKFGYLVLTTGNKSEMATGYCTLYGDMAGGFALIKDVPKTLVYELSGYLNKINPDKAIPRSIIKRAPTAELRPRQRDQQTLPPYPVLDAILEAYVERHISPDKIRTASPAIVKKVVRMIDRSEYKRRQAPPGVKITPLAFGRDRRIPITNCYSG